MVYELTVNNNYSSADSLPPMYDTCSREVSGSAELGPQGEVGGLEQVLGNSGDWIGGSSSILYQGSASLPAYPALNAVFSETGNDTIF